MGKKKAKQKPKPPAKEAGDGFLIKHPLLFLTILAFVLLIFLYHGLVLEGKTIQTPDKLTSLAHKPFFEDAAKRGIFPLWTPYIFSGMPSYGSLLGVPKIVNIFDYPLRTALDALSGILPNAHFTFIFLNYLFFALLMYAMMRGLSVAPLGAVFSGLAVILIPQFVAFTAFGHNTKFLSLMLIPLIFLFAMKLLRQRNLLYFSLLALAIGFQFLRAHVQVVYYTFLMLGLYFIWEAIQSWRSEKSLKNILTSGVLLIAAMAAGAVLSSVIYVSVFDYQQYSIRGGQGGGLDFGYASSWSFHPLEMVTFFIPSFMGFGGQTYWGKMPFTDYPLYFSIVVFFLAGIAFILKRDKVTWFFGIVAIFSLVVSFGRHFPLLYTPMFKFLPFFNKFRVPSMIHILLDLAMVTLAGYGLHALFQFAKKGADAKESQKTRKHLATYFYIFAGLMGVFLLFMVLGKSIYLGMVAASRSHLTVAQRELTYNKALIDTLKSTALLLVALFLCDQHLKARISQLVLGVALMGLVILDLVPVDTKIIHPQPKAKEIAYFAETPAVKFIKQDESLFRIFPVLDDKTGNWYMRHFIQNINGYSAAKLRIYQDFLEETGFNTRDQFQLNPFISKYWRYTVRENRPTWVPVPIQQIDQQRRAFHNAMLDMLNVKYLINSYLPINDPKFRRVQDQQPWVYENIGVLPRAFFVDSIEVRSGRKPIFDRMKDGSFDPGRTAILEQEPPFRPGPADSNRVEITHYDIHEIKLQADVKEPALLVLSEIYYPGGWKAFVDGQETKIFKTNYILRSIFLEPGAHEIQFIFRPKSFMIGVWISIATLVLLLVLFAVGLYMKFKARAQENQIIS